MLLIITFSFFPFDFLRLFSWILECPGSLQLKRTHFARSNLTSKSYTEIGTFFQKSADRTGTLCRIATISTDSGFSCLRGHVDTLFCEIKGCFEAGEEKEVQEPLSQNYAQAPLKLRIFDFFIFVVRLFSNIFLDFRVFRSIPS